MVAITTSGGRPGSSLYFAVVTRGDSAEADVDYTSITTTVDLPVSHWTQVDVGGDTRYRTSATATLRILDDDVNEPDETLFLQLGVSPSSSQATFVKSDVPVVIVDDDVPAVKVSGSRGITTM